MHNHVELQCLQCGQAFTVTMRSYKIKCKQKFCSPKCSTDYKASTWTEITCKWCGKTKLVRKIYVTRGQYKYCSEVCRREAKRQGLSKDDLRRICKTCGKVFYARPSRPNRMHCSLECRKRRAFKNCEHCGERFEYARNETGRRFCSNECYKAHAPETTIEKAVREYLQSLGVVFETQRGIGSYVVDFVIPAQHLIIEADGEYWHENKRASMMRRADRDGFLESQGFEVMHLTEQQIKSGAFMRQLASLN